GRVERPALDPIRRSLSRHGEPRPPEVRRPFHARASAARCRRLFWLDDHRPEHRLHGGLHLRLQRLHGAVRAGSRLWAFGFRLSAFGFGLWAFGGSGFRLWAQEFRLSAFSFARPRAKSPKSKAQSRKPASAYVRTETDA